MVSAEMSWPTVELLVSIGSTDAETVTVSLTLPTRRAMFTLLTWSTLTATLSSATLSNPL